LARLLSRRIDSKVRHNRIEGVVMALTFDSVDDIAQNLNGIAILDSSDWTMAGWIKTSNDGETGAGAIIAIQSLDTSRCVMGFTNGRPGAIQAFDNGATDATATTTDTDFSDNAWCPPSTPPPADALCSQEPNRPT
jgi:hypothetical protein